MSLERLRPKPSERMLIVGATGTGKTTLARELLRGYERVLIIDPKCTYDPQDRRYRLVVHPGAVRDAIRRYPLVHYRAAPRHHSVDSFDAVYRAAYDQRNLMVYTDETALVVRNPSLTPDWLNACVRCGRELEVGMIFSTQRPAGIPLPVYTESEHKICFFLAHDDDRKRMRQEMGSQVMIDPVRAAHELSPDMTPDQQALAEHAFWRWYARERHTRLSVVSIPNRGGE